MDSVLSTGLSCYSIVGEYSAFDCPHGAISLKYTLTGGNSYYTVCSDELTIQDAQQPILSHYNITVASYRNAVWYQMDKPRDNQVCFWNGRGHPNSPTHILVADVVYVSMMAMLAKAEGLTEDASVDCQRPPVSLYYPEQTPEVRCASVRTCRLSIPLTSSHLWLLPTGSTGKTYRADRVGLSSLTQTGRITDRTSSSSTLS